VNLLDENIAEEERLRLRAWRIRTRHIGHDFERKGVQDEGIIPMLHQLRHVTFFTRDGDFYGRSLCHSNYCLVFLAVAPDQAASFIRRFLRHNKFQTQAQRMGCVIRASSAGLTVWRLHAESEISFTWS